MRNVFHILKRDLLRLIQHPASLLVLLFLIVLPCLYAWFNIEAFWDPYQRTEDLRVCVVNEDEGVDDPTLGDLDVGSMIIEELHQNHEMGWYFTDRDEAMDQLESGKAFAGFMIPKGFSADIATIITNDPTRPQIDYYVNEKLGPITPRITDVGATTLDATINDAFFAAVSSRVADTVNERIEQNREHASEAKSEASSQLSDAIRELDAANEALATMASASEDARSKAQGAQGKLGGIRSELTTLSNQLADAAKAIGDTNTALVKVSGDANSALDEVSKEMSGIAADVNRSLGQTSEAISRAHGILQSMAPQNQEWQDLVASMDEAARSSAEAAQALNAFVDGTLARTDSYRNDIATKTVPELSSSLTAISSASSQLSATVGAQQVLVEQLDGILTSLQTTLGSTTGALEDTQGMLSDMSADLATMRTDIQALRTANSLEALLGTDSIDSKSVAEFMRSPTHVVTEELYPLNSFGSAMAPLFINLTLWIGIFMLMVILRLGVDSEGVEDATVTQRYFGRFLLFAIMAILQATVCCTGCLILGIQMESAVLFYLTTIVAALAYLAIQYTLSSLFQHIGKAICVILVFVQIPGATGLYPIEMTPDFFQAIYVIFPFTYGINALRETICGFYDGTWASCMGMLIFFFALFIAIGVFLRPYLINLNRLFAREIASGGLVNGERVELPARRWPLSQLIKALGDREEFRRRIALRIDRYRELYPRLKEFAFAIGIIVPVLFTILCALLHVEKIIILTAWLAWLFIVVAYLVIVEYFKDYLDHLAALNSMDRSQMEELMAEGGRKGSLHPQGSGASDE